MFKEYLSIPYVHKGRSRIGVDCYGLIILLYKERKGIDLYDVEGYSKEWDVEENYFVANYYKEWEKIDSNSLRPFDVLLFCIDEPVPTHIGLFVEDDKFIHSMEDVPVSLGKLNRFWKPKLYGAYRYRGKDS